MSADSARRVGCTRCIVEIGRYEEWFIYFDKIGGQTELPLNFSTNEIGERPGNSHPLHKPQRVGHPPASLNPSQGTGIPAGVALMDEKSQFPLTF